MHQFDDPAVLTKEGVFVSQKWLRLSEIIQDQWPDVSLRWIPPGNRSDIDRSRPYAIVHSPDGRAPYVVMFAGESDDPVDILARLYTGDTTKHDVLKHLEAMDTARRVFELKEQLEKREEAEEKAAWFMGTNKNWIMWRRPDGSLVKYDRTIPGGGVERRRRQDSR